jgi:hypothetical protein
LCERGQLYGFIQHRYRPVLANLASAQHLGLDLVDPFGNYLYQYRINVDYVSDFELPNDSRGIKAQMSPVTDGRLVLNANLHPVAHRDVAPRQRAGADLGSLCIQADRHRRVLLHVSDQVDHGVKIGMRQIDAKQGHTELGELTDARRP